MFERFTERAQRFYIMLVKKQKSKIPGNWYRTYSFGSVTRR